MLIIIRKAALSKGGFFINQKIKNLSFAELAEMMIHALVKDHTKFTSDPLPLPET